MERSEIKIEPGSRAAQLVLALHEVGTALERVDDLDAAYVVGRIDGKFFLVPAIEIKAGAEQLYDFFTELARVSRLQAVAECPGLAVGGDE